MNMASSVDITSSEELCLEGMSSAELIQIVSRMSNETTQALLDQMGRQYMSVDPILAAPEAPEDFDSLMTQEDSESDIVSPPAIYNASPSQPIFTEISTSSNGMFPNHPPTQENPWAEIVEQPKSRGLRFRYECEGRSAGSVPGESSTNEHKTFPAIKVHNYRGPAIIVVSCVTKENPPYCRPHPHAIVGRDCKKGVCTVRVKDASERIVFPQIGIQCAKKKDVDGALKLRQEINVDPFQTGFDHNQANIDLNVVRLCFQVFLLNEQGRVIRVVAPVVSQAIHDKKSSKDLIICRVDRSSGKARGGDEVFLLCDKVNKEDIKIKLFEENEMGQTVWEDYGDFGQGDVHRQYAIVFRTPAYHSQDITRPVEVCMQLLRPSDSETSEAIPFTYMPDDPDPDRIAEKRKRKAQRLVDLWNYEGKEEHKQGDRGASVRGRLSSMLKGSRRIKKEPEVSQGLSFFDNLANDGEASVSHLVGGSSSLGSATISSISAGSIDSRVIADLSGLSSSDLSVVSTENGNLIISASGGDGTGLNMDSINLPSHMLSGELMNQIDIQQLNAYLQEQGTDILLSQHNSLT